MSTRIDTPVHPASRTPGRGHAQLLVSTGSAVLGLLLAGGLLGDPLAGSGGPAGRLPVPALGVALTGLSLVGLLTLLRRWPVLRRTAAAVQVLGYLVAATSTDLLILLGYLLAAAVPLGAVLLAVLACRRSRAVRVAVVLAVAAVAVWGSATGVLAPANVAGTFARLLPALLAAVAEQLVLAWLALGLLVAVRGLAGSVDGRWRAALQGWLLRHQRGLTLVAAAGPLPYVLVRATWLTPWPQGAGPDLDPSIRLWGLLLGCAALLGCLLTVGLVRPWGSVVPRWVPVLAGRAVPVAAAVVPASAVAAALVLAAVPMVTSTLVELTVGGLGRVLFLLMFPFWLWGPALALATWAYALRRRQDAAAPAVAG